MLWSSISLRALLLLSLLAGCWLESADGAGDSLVCQTAVDVEFARYVLPSLKSRATPGATNGKDQKINVCSKD